MRSNFELLEFSIGDADILGRMPGLPVGQPFSSERIEFLNEVSKLLMSDKEAKLYPDVVTFAFWIRRPNMLRKKEEFPGGNGLRMGRGVIFHIAPSNVAVNYAYSLAAGFVLGNANIVRLPSKEFPQIGIINRAFQSALENPAFRKWKDYLALVRYERNSEANGWLSSICDVRVIWGGDGTVHDIRKSGLRPRAGEVTFADRYSICVIDAATYLRADHPDKIAMDFYNDTYLTDQNACTSPRLVCWMGTEPDIKEAKVAFWGRLHDVVSRKYKFQPIQFVDKFVNCCLAATVFENAHVIKMKDNCITRVQLGRLEPKIQEYRGNSGFFYEYDLKDVMELAPICDARLQTIACLGSGQSLMPLVKSGVRGIDRVVGIGKTMEFDFLWDGYDLAERLTRGVCLSAAE